MSVQTGGSRSRTQRSLVAAYLVIAVAVAGLVVSRGTGTPETSPETANTEPAPAPAPVVRPEVFASPPEIQSGSKAFASPPAVAAGAASQTPAVVAASGPAESSDAAVANLDLPIKALAAKTANPVDQAEPELTLPSWSSKELLADLETNSVELSLHSGSPTLVEARAQVTSIAEEFARFGARFDRRAEFQKRLRRDPGDVLPGEKELVEQSEPSPPEHLIESWVAARPDLQGLPLRLDDSCKLAPQDATTLMRVSRMSLGLRVRLSANTIPADVRAQHADMAATSLVEDTSALVQVLQCEDEALRVRMIKLLSMKNDAESLAALADRALFDISPDVRALAVHMLKLSPIQAVQEKLIAGFDYAWEPVAVNAANALVELDEDGLSLEELRKKLNVPDPHAPYKADDGQWKIRELVRVNHLRNCLLCHAPVVEKKTTFQAIMPEPGKELPRNYYGEGSPSVRPDVTYVVQDFSVMHDLKDQKPWPDRQRFDYFIRERTVSESEASRLREESVRDEPIRHRAIRYAIQKLSAKRDDEALGESSLAVR